MPPTALNLSTSSAAPNPVPPTETTNSVNMPSTQRVSRVPSVNSTDHPGVAAQPSISYAGMDGPEVSLQGIRRLQPLLYQAFPSKTCTQPIHVSHAPNQISFCSGRRYQDVPDYYIWERSVFFQIFSDVIETFIESAGPAIGAVPGFGPMVERTKRILLPIMPSSVS